FPPEGMSPNAGVRCSARFSPSRRGSASPPGAAEHDTWPRLPDHATRSQRRMLAFQCGRCNGEACRTSRSRQSILRPGAPALFGGTWRIEPEAHSVGRLPATPIHSGLAPAVRLRRVQADRVPTEPWTLDLHPRAPRPDATTDHRSWIGEPPCTSPGDM